MSQSCPGCCSPSLDPSEESHPGTIWTMNAELVDDDEGREDADVHPVRDLDLVGEAMRCEEFDLVTPHVY